ncbi:MAG TPA: cytochrome c oxidase assembly factor Coa1 family protein [Prosthecobacter sp.]
MNSEPPPFGDPTNIRRENAAAVKKGVAVGCGGCAFLIVLGIGFVASIFFGIMLLMRGSDVSQLSLQAAQNSEVLKQELGEPIHMGWFIFGSMRSSSGQGTASLAVPVSGPQEGVTLHTTATQQNGVWHLNSVTTTLPSGKEFSLPVPALPPVAQEAKAP